MLLQDIGENQAYLEWGDCSVSVFMLPMRLRRKFYEYLSVAKKNVSETLIALGIEDSHYRHYDQNNMVISRGHIKYALKFCKENGVQLIYGENIKKIIQHAPKCDTTFIDNLPLWGGDKLYKLFDHQRKFVEWALNVRSGVGISATGSGKTLINYTIIRSLQNEDPNNKIMFIVPSITLVKQAYDDFATYSEKDDEWNVDEHVTLLGGKRHTNKNFNLKTCNNILVTTWQSLKGKQKSFFQRWNAVLVDEVHGADANVLKRIIEKCNRAYTKIGGTGSLKGVGSNLDRNSELTLEGLFGGRIEVFSTAKDLMDLGILPKLNIIRISIKHPKAILGSIQSSFKEWLEKGGNSTASARDTNIKKFGIERDVIYTCPKRRMLVNRWIEKLKGTSIIFFNSVENAETYYNNYKGRKIPLIIHGTAKDREGTIEKLKDPTKEYVLFATYKTMSTGVSVKTFDAAILCETTKQRVKTLQSIGRLLRGDKALCIDLGDVTNKSNFLYKHFMERKALYDSVEYEYVNYSEEIT